MPDVRAAAVNTHAKQRQADFIMRTCGLVIESLPQDMKGGLVGDEDRSAKPARFLFEIAVMISAARVVARVCKEGFGYAVVYMNGRWCIRIKPFYWVFLSPAADP